MIQWTDLEVTTDSLRPYERNPRRISKESYQRLLNSLKSLGYHQRIICQPDLKVIGGHQRIRALKELGIAKVRVLVPDRELNEAEFRQLLIQDNLPFGDFDFEMLANDFDAEELLDWGMPEKWLGDFAKAGPAAGLTDEDDTPETPNNPLTVIGDLWELDAHRVRCGDSTDAAHVAALLGDIKPHLMVTDPPYGVEYDANWRNEAARNSEGMGNRHLGAGAVGKVLNDDRADWREAWDLFPGNIAYVWHAGLFAPTVAESLVASGFKLRSQIIWAKSHFAIGRWDYHWHHEPCWYAVRGTGNWTGDRKQSTIWQIQKPAKSETGHSTQKPVECMRRPIENNSSAGQAVYDPFLGSGTTLIAAEQTGRTCFGSELSPAYVDVIVKRWEAFSGKKATVIRDGKRLTLSDLEQSKA